MISIIAVRSFSLTLLPGEAWKKSGPPWTTDFKPLGCVAAIEQSSGRIEWISFEIFLSRIFAFEAFSSLLDNLVKMRMWTAENAVWNNKVVCMWLNNMTQQKVIGRRRNQRSHSSTVFAAWPRKTAAWCKSSVSLFSKMHLIYINNGRRVKLRPTEIICTPLSVHETNRARPRYDLLTSLCRPPLYRKKLDRLVLISRYRWTINL